MSTDDERDGSALLCDLFGADAGVVAEFLSATTGPMHARGDGDVLLVALVSGIRYRSAREASTVLGVLPKTVIQRCRRAITAAGLDDEPFERLLLATAALVHDATATG